MAKRDFRIDELEPEKAPVYLATRRYCFTRNGTMVILPAGKLYYRKSEGALIDDALRLKAPLQAIDTTKLFHCPHCGAHSLLK